MNHFVGRIAVICLVMLVSGCASLHLMKPASKSNGQSSMSSQDAEITNRVNAAFVRDKGIPAFDIKVSTLDGVVTLRGTVSSQAIKSRTLNLTAGTKGVKSVRNQLRVR